MTYLQMTVCKYFRKWSEYDEKYMISHSTFPQAVGMVLSLFQGDIFGGRIVESCTCWCIIHEQRAPLSYLVSSKGKSASER